MPRVQYNETNLRHCRCPECPVELASACSKAKLAALEKGEKISENEMPKLYCSIGKAVCTDMDFKNRCLCPSCLVWEENDLRNDHYCQKGSADANH